MIDFEDVFIAVVGIVSVAFVVVLSIGLVNYAENQQSPACVTHMGQVIYVNDLDVGGRTGQVNYEYDGKSYYSNQATYWYVEEGQNCE